MKHLRNDLPQSVEFATDIKNIDSIQSYEEWEEANTVTANYQVGREAERSVMRMLGMDILLESFFPWNVFKPNYCRVVAHAFNITTNDPIMELARKHGGQWEEGYYAEEGYGNPIFTEKNNPDVNVTKQCWDFLIEYNKLQK